MFLLWVCLFILSRVTSPLFSSSMLGNYRPGEFIFQCLFFSFFFTFTNCSHGFQGKITEAVCHSLLQWATFCQNSPPLCPWTRQASHLKIGMMQMANRHRKDVQYHYREMKIKTMISYPLTPIRMCIIKKNTNKNFWQRCWKKENPPTLGWWKCKLVWSLLKTL